MKISSYTKVLNCVEMGYPFIESIKSMIPFSDEVIVVDNGSTDSTVEKLKAEFSDRSKVKIFFNKVDLSIPRFAINADGEQKAHARSLCNGDVLFQFDVDEIVHEDDYTAIRDCCKYIYDNSSSPTVFLLPIIEYWGSQGKIRCDVPFYKTRISLNDPRITHGLPESSTRIDKNGNAFSVASDGCDYIFKEDKSLVGVSSILTNAFVEQARISYFEHYSSKGTFLKFFNKIDRANGRLTPVLRHYSWFSLERKIKNFRDYWGKHWSSMFDSVEHNQNMFFNKPWDQVSDKEIKELAVRLSNESSGWIFHRPIDWMAAASFPFIIQQDTHLTHPFFMEDWKKKNE